jgi:outer membrane protein OmpA-like peptidoglycan-associated protein
MKSFIQIVLFLLAQISLLNTSFTQIDSFNLYYDLGIYELTTEQQNFLQSRIDSLNPDQEYKVQVKGSADYLGTPESNQILSENRAKAVFDYIATNADSLIIENEFLGLGEIAFEGDETQNRGGVQEDRKVTVYFRFHGNKIKTKLGTFEVGQNLVLQNLNFQPGRHVLIKESIPTLKALLKVLEDNPSLEIEIEGHICCHSNPKEKDGFDMDTREYKLSENRAKNIHNYLIRQGIAKERLSYKGFAFNRPLYYPERTLEHQNKNRRVEVKVIKM